MLLLHKAGTRFVHRNQVAQLQGGRGEASCRHPCQAPARGVQRTAAQAELAVDVAGAEPVFDVSALGDAAGSASPSTSAQAAAITREQLVQQVACRRNFAIISHPDAGKTTLTEKLLLYGGAIHEAGEVKARASTRSATSDWMELERARGISITSTAMTFRYGDIQVNLLDTPGHQDFSEDTYRTLAAADNAVMLVDGAKGIEPQTRKLFEVARMRSLPCFTFVNKLDRPSLNGFDIIEQLETEFGLTSYPVTWPIGSGDRFCGLYHRPSAEVLLYSRGSRGKGATSKRYALHDPQLASLIEPELYEQLQEDVELLEVLGDELDMDAVLSGQVTPMYFGSAFTNFGVDLFLASFVDLAARPGPAAARGNSAALTSIAAAAEFAQTLYRGSLQDKDAANASTSDSNSSSDGASTDAPVGSNGSTSGEGVVVPTSPHFSGLVFKLQANMDPRHRDKVAFVRVVSGKFEKGMKVKVARTGRTVSLTAPQQMFARDRSTVQEGFAGDVIGLTNPGAFAIGDTIYTGPEVAFPPIPSFSPELFAYLRCAPNQKKAFNKGVEGLLGEGAVQVLYSNDDYITDPILAAVGQLQFEVVQYRMKDEYGVDTTLEPLPYSMARWVKGGWQAVKAAGRMFNTTAVKDAWGRPVLLFRNTFALQQVLGEQADQLGELSPYALPPET